MAIETPRFTISYPQKPGPTVNNVKISLSEPAPVTINSGGETCSPNTHSFVITLSRNPAERSMR